MSDWDAHLETERPNTARMYDYLLGGSANFAVDRQAVDALAGTIPDNEVYIRSNRAFLHRVVRYLVTDCGIDQFLDLGSGIPTKGNVHEIAQAENPQVRIAYVDFEPIAVHHARRLLGGTPRVSVTEADLREPETVLSAPGVAELLDRTRPVAVLAVGVVPFLDDEQALQALSAYRQATCRGSYLAISHLSRLGWTEEQMRALLAVSAQTSTPERERSPEQIRRLLQGYALVEPGLVPAPLWHPETTPDEDTVAGSNCYVALGHRS
ncbi:SAM-dependent methyltransferase [Bounagaea algeriensis]